MEIKFSRKNRLGIFLALSVVNVFSKFSNSYDLNKILSWYFNIINFSDISKFLLKEEMLVVKNKEDLNNEFLITLKGEEFLRNETEITENFLISKFPERRKFIITLFKNWNA